MSVADPSMPQPPGTDLDGPVGVLRNLDAAAVGIAVWSSGRTLRYANRTFRNLFHATDGVMEPGLAFADYVACAARSNEWILDGDAATWIADEHAAFGLDKTSQQPLADGRTLEIVQKPAEDGGMVLTVHDISGLKRSEHALREAKTTAEATDQAKSRFLRAANHDLRQPLATLKILIYNCLTADDDDHRTDLLHTMDIAVSIMEDLLSALLQIGQLDASRIVPRVTTFQLTSLFQRLDIQFAHQAAEKGLSLRFAGAAAAVRSDKALLERVLSNLVGNALRYTDVGGVLVGCRRKGQMLRIEIWDTGRGIVAADRDRIFDEFYRVPEESRAKNTGLGLGLNIVKRLAELLDHAITVKSVPGQGSMFAVTVPIGNVWHSTVGEPEISEMLGGEFAGLSVLLIEDDEVLRRAMRELLERWGIDVHAAQSEDQARRLLVASGIVPRLIIADYSLREQDGPTVIRNIMGQLGTAVPSIIVTADNAPHVTERLRAEALPVLIKPVSPPRLRVLMHNLLFEPGQFAPTEF